MIADAPDEAVRKPTKSVTKNDNDKPLTETIGIIIALILLPKAFVIKS